MFLRFIIIIFGKYTVCFNFILLERMVYKGKMTTRMYGVVYIVFS